MATKTKMATTIVAFYILNLFGLFSMITASRSNILELKLGKIRGERKTVNGKQINVYLGVPYAEPPVGSLRFRKPAPKKPWTRIIDTTEYGPSCIQAIFPGTSDLLQHIDISEDCLNLNVYVPVSDNKEPMAVMVWIHGGGYGVGSGMATPCEELALHGDIVCVTVNYRLGVFGFLSTQDGNAPGNYGLWDQHEALKWVKEHISSFGGDSESITIFGESAGGSSVQHQAVSKYNVGIVKRAISQSPPTFSNGFAFSKKALHTAKSLGRQLNCNTTDNEDLKDTLKLINCLRLANADDILNEINMLMQANINVDDPSYEMLLAPVEDGDIVPYGLKKYFSASKEKNNPEIDDTFGKVDWMIGSLLDDGHILLYTAAMLQDMFGFNFTLGVPEDIRNNKFIAPVIKSLYPEILETFKKHNLEFYTHKTDPIKNTLAMRNFFSDVQFHLHVVESCLAHVRTKLMSNAAEKRATYAYLITHVLSGKNTMDYLMGFSLPSWTKCAAHGDDIPLVFGTHFVKESIKVEWSEEDAKTAKAVRTFWTNFAKTGNPNKGLPLEGVASWEEYTEEKRGYINIGKEIKMEHDLLPGRMRLWLHTIPEEIEKQRAMKQKTEL